MWRPTATACCLLLTGCASAPTSPYRESVAIIGAHVTRDRDAVPHPGPRWTDIDPALLERASSAANDQEYYVELSRVIDALDDEHAYVDAKTLVGIAYPANTRYARIDGVDWISLGQPWPVDHANELWGRLVAIDGHRPRTRNGCTALLGLPALDDADLARPVPPIRLTVTLRDGTEVERLVERGYDQWGGPIEILGASGYEKIWLDPRVAVGRDPQGMPTWLTVARLGPARDVGYLRIYKDVNDARFRHGHVCPGDDLSECPNVREIDGAMQSLHGCRAIILDLQGCRGGTCVHGGRVAGWLFPPDVVEAPFEHVIHEPVPIVGDLFGWSTTGTTCWSLPAPSARLRWEQLVIMVDGRTGSAAEHIPACFRGMPGVTIVGATTGGAEYSLLRLKFRDSLLIAYGGAPAVWKAPRGSVEGIGVAPDVRVECEDEIIRRFGPVIAIELQRRESLMAALRVVGLEPNDWIDGGDKSAPPATPTAQAPAE